MKNKIAVLNGCSEDAYSLWNDAFGDSREEIEFFVNNCIDYQLIGYYLNGELASMLFLVDCTVGEKPCKYIYAACTRKEHKRKGFMTELLNYCKQNYRFISLIPANEGLVSFYKKNQFSDSLPVSYLSFNQSQEINDYLISGCELDKPFLLCYVNGK